MSEIEEQYGHDLKEAEVAQMTQDRIAEILREKGWVVRYEDGVVEALRKVDLTRSRTYFRFPEREMLPRVFRDSPVHAMFRLLIPLDVSGRTAAYRLYRGDEPTGVEPLRDCDFEEALSLEVDHVGEIPLERVIEGGGGLDLVRAQGTWGWDCDLFTVFSGEYFIRRTDTDEPPHARYYRPTEKDLRRLLEVRLPLGLPGEDAHEKMEAVVARLEAEQGTA